MKKINIAKFTDKIAIGLVILIALFGLFGWAIGELSFAKVNILYIPIAPSTSISFIIVSIVLLILTQKKRTTTNYSLYHVLLFSVIAFSGIVINDWLFIVPFNVENIFIENPEGFGEVVKGKIPPLTAALFILESFAILFYTSLQKKSSKYIYGATVSISFFMSSILLIGYLYNVPLLYGGQIIPVALPTAVCFWLLSIALILVTEFKIKPFTFLSSNSIENKLVRAFLPLTLFLIVLTGYFNSSVFTKFENPLLFSSLSMVIALPVFTIIIMLFSKNIGKSLKGEETKNKKLSEAIEQSGYSIVITDLAGNIEYTNSKYTDVTGHTSKEILGKNTRIINSGEQSKETYSSIWKNISDGKIWNGEFKNKKKNGELFWEDVTISPIKNDTGQILNYLAIKKNITKLKESEKKYRDLVNVIPDGIYKRTSEGRFIEANPSMLKILGYDSIEELLAIDINSDLYFDPKDRDNVELSENEKELGIYRLKRKDGSEIWVEDNGWLSKDEKGHQLYHEGVLRDVTERIYSEQLLKEKSEQIEVKNKELLKSKEKAEESDQLKTEFINNLSHEIRTPMNGILGFSGMLNDNGLSDEKRANFIKIIQGSGKQLLNVIDDIIEISKLGTKQVKVVETDVCLNHVLLELFSTFDLKAKEQKNPLYLKKALSDKQSTIRTDITKVNKVLSNLLENALKFTNEGFIEFGYQLKNNQIELYVKDTGVGIEKSKHESIFERFSQEEKELSKNVGGLGLGLSIAKENAELVGGNIRLESKKGEGATFFVIIPYKPVYKDTDIEKSKTESKYTILIAEDEEVNYLYIETLLKDVFSLDCIIIHATNGKEAVEACEENKTIDLVLMDLKMPVMNGFEATQQIKKRCPKVPVIAQTAYSTVIEKEKAISVGCDDFISKPINQQSFKNILDKYLIKKLNSLKIMSG